MGWVGIGICSCNLLLNMIFILRDIIGALKKGCIKAKKSICDYASSSPVCKMNDCFKLIDVKEPPHLDIDGKIIVLTPRKLEKYKAELQK
jgi:hypothetical protein